MFFMNPSHTTLSPAALTERLASPHPPLLLDVRLPEDCECSRLPGAAGNCVFEVSFTGRLPELAPDKSRPLCVYGAGSGSLEGRMAVEKLIRLGYTDVCELSGGIDAWRAAGLPLEESGIPSPATPTVKDGVHFLDLEESRILWIGRNLLNRHEGRIALKSGQIRIENGRLTGGGFVIDMTAIECSDLAGDPLHDVLIRHLLDHDFFDAEIHPEAFYQITGSTPVAGAAPGSPNLILHGNLTLKGVTAPLDITACAGVTPEGKPAAQAVLAFDRTLWNVLYGSGKWFHRLGGHLVNDSIELQLRMVGK